MTRRQRKELIKGYLFISPWLVGFLVFTVIPVFLSFHYSLTDYALMRKGPSLFVGTENYRRLLGDEIFWKTLRNTAYYASVALPGGMIIALGLALLLNMRV